MLMFIIQTVLLLIAIFLIVNGVSDILDGCPIDFQVIGGTLLLVVWCLTLCVTFIPVNTVGIKYSPLSGTSNETLSEGLAFKSPLDKIYTISTTIQEKTVEKVAVQTKDAQWVSMSINIKYQVNSSNAFKIFQNYKTLDKLQDSLIANATQRAIEEVTTKYNVIEVLGESRNNIYTEIENTLKNSLATEGVDLKFITIMDTDAGEAIENAIQEEAVQKKAVETALQKQEQARIEAETKLIQAEGEAKANEVKTKALTDEVLLEMWINKWNGKLPTVSGSNDTIIDLSQLMGE